MFVAKSLNAEHKDLIHDVAFDFYGRRMATCSSDQSVKVIVSGSHNVVGLSPSFIVVIVRTNTLHFLHVRLLEFLHKTNWTQPHWEALPPVHLMIVQFMPKVDNVVCLW